MSRPPPIGVLVAALSSMRARYVRAHRQLWTMALLRQDGCSCSECRAPLPRGTDVYRPITNATNRADRMCVPCGRRLAVSELR